MTLFPNNILFGECQHIMLDGKCFSHASTPAVLTTPPSALPDEAASADLQGAIFLRLFSEVPSAAPAGVFHTESRARRRVLPRV